MSMLKVDLELVKKYNVAGPRYTSYPPATKFTEALKWPELADRILENNRTERDLSLYFHIPFCETLCWYCGCTTVITLNHNQGSTYLNYLEQEAVHRIQPREMTEQVLTWARELGFSSINFDLIYGLPHQTVESFNRTLDDVLSLKPDRLAVFSYAHVPWVKPAQKILEQKVLPTAEVKLQLLKTVIERLTENNRYVYIGMDHFARPVDELAVAQRRKELQRNFQGYSTRGGSDIYSFGMSAISQIPDAYWQNEKDLPKYYTELDAGKAPLTRGYVMSEEDKLRREVIMRVMCDLSLDYVGMSQRLGFDFASHFEREIESLSCFENDGLVKR